MAITVKPTHVFWRDVHAWLWMAKRKEGEIWKAVGCGTLWSSTILYLVSRDLIAFLSSSDKYKVIEIIIFGTN